jgi:NAD(P)-dependent dehydrogenase (short-subunit alcohol dehydrogenase family)
VTAVLVTGGGTGIGAAVTRLLCAGGDQVASRVAAVAERFGRLDGLVLNAGIMVPGGGRRARRRSPRRGLLPGP